MLKTPRNPGFGINIFRVVICAVLLIAFGAVEYFRGYNPEQYWYSMVPNFALMGGFSMLALAYQPFLMTGRPMVRLPVVSLLLTCL